jgi:hypothetical protein
VHLIVTTIPTKRPLVPDEVGRIERELPDLAAKMAGYRGFYWARTTDTEMLTVSIWDSQAEADTALEQIRPWLIATLGPLMAGAPERRVGEVLVAHQA